jgi:hypothetical protein
LGLLPCASTGRRCGRLKIKGGGPFFGPAALIGRSKD